MGTPKVDDDNSHVCDTTTHFLVSKALSNILSSIISCDGSRRRPDSQHPIFADEDKGVRKLGSFAQADISLVGISLAEATGPHIQCSFLTFPHIYRVLCCVYI